MKKVIMTREKICKSKEFVIDPETQKVLDNRAFCENEDEDDDGYWNEYYRVGIVDDKNELNDCFDTDLFMDTVRDFYDFPTAKEAYREMVKELEEEERYKYLLEKQKVCNLDHSELLELQAFEKEM